MSSSLGCTSASAAPAGRASQVWFTAAEARWLVRWLEHRSRAALAPVPERFVHTDIQPTDVMVADHPGGGHGTDAPSNSAAPAYRALIDHHRSSKRHHAADTEGHHWLIATPLWDGSQ